MSFLKISRSALQGMLDEVPGDEVIVGCNVANLPNGESGSLLSIEDLSGSQIRLAGDGAVTRFNRERPDFWAKSTKAIEV